MVVARYAGAEAHQEDWDLVGLNEALHRQFDFRLADLKVDDIPSHEALVELVTEAVETHYRRREGEMGTEMFHRLERWIILGLEWDGGGFRGINQLWREHLLNMDHLKEGIGLRGYGQRDPLTEYKKEAFDMFQEMIGSLKETAVEQLFKVRMTQEDAPATRVAQRAMPEWQESRGGRSRHRAGAPRDREGGAADRRRPEGGPQRSVPLRLRQEVQEVLPPQGPLTASGAATHI